MTAPRYRAANNKEIVVMRVRVSTGPAPPTYNGSPRMMAADAQPAIRDARTYFQMAASTGAIPKFIGLPAYQKAGIVKIQKDAAQATAIPTGPHDSAMRNNRQVTVASRSAQRSQRSVLPMERWTQPCMW